MYVGAKRVLLKPIDATAAITATSLGWEEGGSYSANSWTSSAVTASGYDLILIGLFEYDAVGRTTTLSPSAGSVSTVTDQRRINWWTSTDDFSSATLTFSVDSTPSSNTVKMVGIGLNNVTSLTYDDYAYAASSNSVYSVPTTASGTVVLDIYWCILGDANQTMTNLQGYTALINAVGNENDLAYALTEQGTTPTHSNSGFRYVNHTVFN